MHKESNEIISNYLRQVDISLPCARNPLLWTVDKFMQDSYVLELRKENLSPRYLRCCLQLRREDLALFS